jgi:hypothetical protein
MADFLERARLVSKITELRKQQSGSTGDERITRQMRDSLIGSLRQELAALDDGEPGLIRGAPRIGAPRSRER